MLEPQISVIMAAYNRADLIGDSIRSVQKQTLQEWELIVVDDGSTDGTPDVVAGYADGDARIRFYHRQFDRKRDGGAVCRNEGVGYARSDLLVFLDSDDLMAPECLARRVAFMQTEGSDLDFVVFQTEVFRQAPGDMGLCFNRLDYADDIEHYLMKDAIWISTGPTWRREPFLKMGCWNESLASSLDWELTTRALIKGLRYQKVDVVDSYFRMNNGQRKSVTGRAMELGTIRYGLLAIEFVNSYLYGVNKEKKYRSLLRYSAYIRCYDLCTTHHHGAYAMAATRLFWRRLFRFRDLVVAYAIALVGALMDRLSSVTDRLVWQRFPRERESFKERWQYKWVCPAAGGGNQGSKTDNRLAES